MSGLAGPPLNRENRGKIGNGTQEVPLGALSPDRELWDLPGHIETASLPRALKRVCRA